MTILEFPKNNTQNSLLTEAEKFSVKNLISPFNNELYVNTTTTQNIKSNYIESIKQ